MTLKSECRVKSAAIAGAVACLALLAAAPAGRAETHYGIISTERSSPKTTARISLVSNVSPGGATFTVFPAASAPISDTVQLDDNLFATSASSSMPEIANLFTGSGALTALVRADYLGAASAAVLEQSSLDGKIALDLPPSDRALGARFAIPIGDLHQGTLLLVGNPFSSPNPITLRYGPLPPESPVPIGAWSVLVIEVTRANTMLHMTVQDPSLFVMAQLAVDTGKTTVMRYLKPASIVE